MWWSLLLTGKCIRKDLLRGKSHGYIKKLVLILLLLRICTIDIMINSVTESTIAKHAPACVVFSR